MRVAQLVITNSTFQSGFCNLEPIKVILEELILAMAWLDYPRFPISQLHLGKFTDSMEFQSWKVNSKTEVFSRSAVPHLTLHWIKEVEIAKSIDELLTSRSITGRTDVPTMICLMR